jgi:hypothetical protein
MLTKKIKMIKPQLERFRNEFLDYFQEDILLAEFDGHNHLIVFANPFLKFDELIVDICDHISETAFDLNVYVHLYPFGKNESVIICIN